MILRLMLLFYFAISNTNPLSTITWPGSREYRNATAIIASTSRLNNSNQYTLPLIPFVKQRLQHRLCVILFRVLHQANSTMDSLLSVLRVIMPSPMVNIKSRCFHVNNSNVCSSNSNNFHKSRGNILNLGAGGYCVINNVAVAAKYAQEKLGMKKILIVDWDGKQLSFAPENIIVLLMLTHLFVS